MASEKETVAAKVPQEDKEEIEEIAYNLSSPSDTVGISDLVRHALNQTFGIGTTSLDKGPKKKTNDSEPSGDFSEASNGKLSDTSEGVYNESPTDEPSDITNKSETQTKS